MMKRVTSISALVLIVVLLGQWAYAQKTTPSKTLDIGIATPLTGPAAHIGMNMKNALLMAIEDQNAQGGVKIAGEKYLLNPIILDTKKDAAVGKAVAEQLVYDKKVKVIAGPFIDDSIGAQSVTEPNKIIAFFCDPLYSKYDGTRQTLFFLCQRADSPVV
jgi:ABC-type branched-subunit amino acid transport system substrate-binding protein